MRYMAAYGAAFVAFLGLDFLWLSVFAGGFYARELGPLLLPQGRLGPAAAFYLLYLAGIMVFVVAPALQRGRWTHAAGLGALFGLVAYGAYDLTNLSTLKGFPAILAAVDMTWGATVTAVAASAGYAAGRIAGRRA